MLNWLIARLKEGSSIRGIVWLLTVFGLSLRPEQAEAIVTVGMALAGLLGVFLSDESKNISIELPPIELIGQSQGYNDASQDMGETPVPQSGRASADMAPKNPVIHRTGAGAGAERDHSASDGLRQPVSPVDYPIGGSDDTYPNLPPAGFGDRD